MWVQYFVTLLIYVFKLNLFTQLKYNIEVRALTYN